MKHIMIEPEDWQKILNLLSIVSYTLIQSKVAAEAFDAINRAQEVETEVKEPEKKK